MTKTNTATPAQLALLDKIASTGHFSKQQWRTADVLIQNHWIEQRPAPGRTEVDGLAPWWITDEGSRIRSRGADDL